MNILVIGNGFDIAHGLPTKYGEFLDFIKLFKRKIRKVKNWKNEKEFNIHQIDYIDNLFSTRTDNNHSDKIINELSELIENNKWINYFLKIEEDMKKDGKEGWIDFESEISKIIKALDRSFKNVNKYIKKGYPFGGIEQYNYNILCKILGCFEKDRVVIAFLIDNKQFLINDLNRLIRCLEIYLDDFINKITDYKKMDLIKSLNPHRILSFNYTNTFQRIYGVDNANIKYHYIHGKANINHTLDNSDIVLGIDEYLPNGEKDNNIEFIQFKKFYQRIYKKTGSNYRTWLREIDDINNRFNKIQKGNRILFIGHSLDVTDKDILRDLLLSNLFSEIIIYHHNQEALSSQISNLVKAIGQDKLIELTGNEIIKFEQL